MNLRCFFYLLMLPCLAGETVTTEFPDPGRPGLLTIDLELPKVRLVITGHRESRVIARLSMADGPTGSPMVSFTDKDNQKTLHLDPACRGDLDLEIMVPLQTSLAVELQNGSTITVAGVHGDHEIGIKQGHIHMTGIRGSAVMAVNQGTMRVSFDAVDETKAMSFVAYKGDIEVTFPAEIRAEIKLTVNRCNIDSDFALDGKQRLRREQHAKPWTTIVNGGGSPIRFTLNTGNLRLLKK